MSARLAPVSAPFDPSVAATIDRLRPPGSPPLALFTTLAHNPRVLSRLFAGGLLDAGSISVRQRELVILRTCAQAGADYEWGVHAALFGGQAGLTAEQVAATKAENPLGPDWSEDDLLLLDTADALYAQGDLNDRQWGELSARFDQAQMVELLALAGYYRTIALLCRTLRLPAEGFTAVYSAAPASA
ncbi:carboxymuconolactone decarboxylase family protein [Niveispirillum sp. KHB5.9]|uniref:carboxymuconolactone decarboxylase family protein n=1 Tax=Niveispirillum sp. KHB5.9 TaxID=3400269 RepID=UPI003A84D3DD